MSSSAKQDLGYASNGYIIVDLPNVLLNDPDANGKAKSAHIPPLYRQLVLDFRYQPKLVSDARFRYRIDNKEHFDKAVQDKLIILAPPGRKADPFILEMARGYDCKILSNDLFREYRGKFGARWINERRVPFVFYEGILYID